MKLPLTIAALCTLAPMSFPVHAQSSVTLYGALDAAARHVSNSGLGSAYSLVSGSNDSSSLGLRASEDLGGGLSALFHLNSLISVDTGGAGSTSFTGAGAGQSPTPQFWNRFAYVGLRSAAWGEVRAGLDLVPTYRTWNRSDPFRQMGVGNAGNIFGPTQNGPFRAAFGGVNKNETTVTRAHNIVQYFTPDLNGFAAGIILGAREGGTAQIGNGKVVGARIGYETKKLVVEFSTMTTDVQPTLAVAVNKGFRDSVVSLGYDFGPVRLAAAARRFSFQDARQMDYLLSAWVPMPLGTVIASFGKANLSGSVSANLLPGTAAGSIGADDASQLAAGYIYDLSKRTALYGYVARINNDGRATNVIPGGPAATTANFAGGKSTGYEFGIRHYF